MRRATVTAMVAGPARADNLRVMRVLTFALVTVLLSALAAPVRAQSLGDIAKKEEERRKQAPTAGKTYTNKDLPAVAPLPASAEPSPVSEPAAAPEPDDKEPPAPKGTDTAGAPAAAAPASASSSAPAAGAGSAADPKGRDYWQQRMRQAKEQLERNRVLADALQSRLNALDTDFVNRDDPAQRARIAGDRTRTQTELDRLKKSIAIDEKAIPALEEEARRAGIPPGWLR